MPPVSPYRERGPSLAIATSESRFLEDLASCVDRLASSGGGEIGVTTSSSHGSVHVTGDGVAWVVSGDSTERLSTVLVRRSGVSMHILRDTFRRCRAEGSNFAESLVEAGVLERQTVRAALLEHNARQLRALHHARPELLDARRVQRRYASSLVFATRELVAAMGGLPDQTPAPPRSAHGAASPEPATQPKQQRSYDMANIKQSLEEVLKIEGGLAAALVDWESGLTLGTIGSGGAIDIELAASGNTSVVKAKMAVMRSLGIEGGIEDMLITLQSQYHLIRPLVKNPQLFLYVAIDRQRGNLGLARHRLRQIEEALVL